MTALVRPPCTTSVTDGLCVFPYFAAPHSIIRYQRVKCSSTVPRARATCTAHIYSTVPTDILNHFWIQVAVSLLKPPHGGFRSETAVTKPFRKWNGYKFITAIC